MSVVQTTLGGLTCRVTGHTGEAPAGCVVLCHGYGAPGTDLIGLAPELFRLAPALAEGVRFVFPEAPLVAEATPFGRAWWQLDLEALEAAIRTGSSRDLHLSEPEGLPSARRQLTALLDELTAATGLPLGKVFLGGFSQGAMLATDVTLRLEEAPAGLAILSGTLLNEDEWTRRAGRRAGLRVIQSHGRRDPLLPFEQSVRLKEILDEAGLDVTWLPFEGEHTISAEAVSALAERLKEAFGA